MTILDCGHEPSPHLSFTTGYGVDRSGRKHCYECCAKRDVADMVSTGRATLYLSNGEVSNWPGSLKFRAHVRKGRHNIARTRYDAWFTGPDGKQWHGVQYGDNTQICHCKRLK